VPHSQVNADLIFHWRERFSIVHLTGEDGIPVACFIFAGAGLGSAFDLAMEFELDCPDLGETDPVIVGEGEPASLGRGEGSLAVPPLKPGVAWLLTILEAAKEAIKGSLHAQEDILEHLAMDLLIVFSQMGLDLWQFAFLLIVSHLHLTSKLFAGRFIILVGMLSHVKIIGVSTFQQGGIVQLAAA
jgi:hypothetical protein